MFLIEKANMQSTYDYSLINQLSKNFDLSQMVQFTYKTSFLSVTD